jgi:hypothetical protein
MAENVMFCTKKGMHLKIYPSAIRPFLQNVLTQIRAQFLTGDFCYFQVKFLRCSHYSASELVYNFRYLHVYWEYIILKTS